MTPAGRWGMMRLRVGKHRPRAPRLHHPGLPGALSRFVRVLGASIRLAPGGEEMAEGVLEFTDQNFQADVIDSDAPVLVDFWAEWCVPCKMIAPAVEALASEYEGRVRIGKLNIDDNPSTPSKFGIRGIPTLMLFKGGEVAEQIVGVKPKADLKAAIDRAL